METLELTETIEEEITDKKIYAAAYAEWLGLMASMWDAIGKDVDDRRLKVYARQFESVPFGLLEKAVDRAIRKNGSYLTVPSVTALWDAIKLEAGDSTGMDFRNRDPLEAVQAWSRRLDAQFELKICRFES